jgi:hypothetical protein
MEPPSASNRRQARACAATLLLGRLTRCRYDAGLKTTREEETLCPTAS